MKVRVTRKTFSKYYNDNIDKLGMASLFIGNDLKESIKNLPDEVPIWIDTDRVVIVSALTRDKTTNEVVFQITFDCNDPQLQNIWIKGDEYEDFLNVWVGQRKWLGEGVYKVGMGEDKNCIQPQMWAELSEDKLTITVHQVKPV